MSFLILPFLSLNFDLYITNLLFQFIDDDTPAPEASIPVPKVGFKANNYIYQTIYILYILAFLAYVYVRITYTLDAPGLNRIYCIVVASLEIVTAPSLILTVSKCFCLIA